MGFFGKYQLNPVTVEDGALSRVLLDDKGRVQTTVTGLTANYETLSFEEITVAASSIPFTSIPTGAIRAVVTVEIDDIRFRTDGNAPSTTVGHLLTTSDVLILESASDIADFRCIRVTNSATLKVTYQS